MLFLDRLKRNCELYGEKPAIEYLLPEGRETVAYGQLGSSGQKPMACLQLLGVRPGDRVVLQLPRCLPFIYLHLAIMRLNAICLPLNPAYPEHELSYFLGDSEAKVLVADVADKDKLEGLTSRLPALESRLYL